MYRRIVLLEPIVLIVMIVVLLRLLLNLLTSMMMTIVTPSFNKAMMIIILATKFSVRQRATTLVRNAQLNASTQRTMAIRVQKILMTKNYGTEEETTAPTFLEVEHLSRALKRKATVVL